MIILFNFAALNGFQMSLWYKAYWNWELQLVQ